MKRLPISLLSVLILSALICPLVMHAQQDRQLVQTGQTGANNSKRIALVIGNGAYTNAPPLKNPPNDAKDMAVALSKLGFEVEHGVDLSQRLMKQMIRQFGQKLKSGGVGLFYFAGHGVQLKGQNYLIPVDADIQSEADVEDLGVNVSLLLNLMDQASNGLNIIILDACRNNPFGRSFRSAEQGLAQVDAPTGTLISYATAPGRVASDGTGRNGLYTAELLRQMRVPGLSVTDMFQEVRAEVVKQTGGKQVPWEASSLVGRFYFNGSAGTSNAASNTTSTATANPGVVEQEYWETIKNSADAEDFREYLKEYPSGPHAVIARSNLRRLEAANSNKSGSVKDGATNTKGGSNLTALPAEPSLPGKMKLPSQRANSENEEVTLYLKDGRTLKGGLINLTDTHIAFLSDKGSVVYPLDQIQEAKFAENRRDTLLLKDGSQIRGTIASLSESVLTVLVGDGIRGRRSRISIYLEDIVQINFGQA